MRGGFHGIIGPIVIPAEHLRVARAPHARPRLKEFIMQKYVCDVCGYIYDPEVGDPDSGIEPGTAFEDIPEDWVCPVCGVTKDDFSVYEG